MSENPTKPAVIETDFTGKGAWGPFVENTNVIARILNGTTSIGAGGDVNVRPQGLQIQFPSVPFFLFGFWYSRASDVVTVKTGDFTIEGTNVDITVAETVITLTGDPEYIYLQFEWGQITTATIEHSSTKPSTNATYYRRRLYRFDLDAETQQYKLGKISHIGDVSISAPLEGGT